MSDVVIDALAGNLHGPQPVAVIAQLMAAAGVKSGSVQRVAEAFTLLERLVDGGQLGASEVSRTKPILGRWRYPVPWDASVHGPKHLRNDLETLPDGRLGFWQVREHLSGPLVAPQAAEQCTTEEVTKFIAPEDLAVLMAGKLGDFVEGEGFRTEALDAWLQTAVQPPGSERQISRRDLLEAYEIVDLDENGKEFDSALKDLKSKGLLKTVKHGLYLLSEITFALEKQGKNWKLRRKTGQGRDRGRAGSGGVLEALWRSAPK